MSKTKDGERVVYYSEILAHCSLYYHGKKCDGAQPICGQCLRAKKPDDCEYTVGNEPTQNQLLEERIRVLETRIQELTSPARANANVTLHQPYQAASEAAQAHMTAVSSYTNSGKFLLF